VTVGGADPTAAPPLDPASLRRDVEALAALGPRFAGTEGERRARDFIESELRAAGHEVATEDFTHLAYEPEAATLTVDPADLSDATPAASLPPAAPTDASLPCAGLQATASGVVEAEAVYVGDGTEDDGSLDGRIVVFRSGVPTTVAPGLAARGAAGLVCLSPAPDGLITHLVASFQPLAGPTHEERVLPVPGVIVEAAIGERLLARLSRGPTRLRLEHRASYMERDSANLVVEIPGTDPDAPKVVVGAHYDSQRESPGAADNATGLAALLAMADYVARHAGERIEAMVNLDALGPPLDATRTIVADPRIAKLAAESARATGWEVEQELNAADFPFADHAPFVAAGIPAAWIWRYPPPHPYYHSSGDTPRWVDFTLLAEDAAASAATTWRLANP
jgi:hypothetical protein